MADSPVSYHSLDVAMTSAVPIASTSSPICGVSSTHSQLTYTNLDQQPIMSVPSVEPIVIAPVAMDPSKASIHHMPLPSTSSDHYSCSFTTIKQEPGMVQPHMSRMSNIPSMASTSSPNLSQSKMTGKYKSTNYGFNC